MRNADTDVRVPVAEEIPSVARAHQPRINHGDLIEIVDGEILGYAIEWVAGLYDRSGKWSTVWSRMIERGRVHDLSCATLCRGDEVRVLLEWAESRGNPDHVRPGGNHVRMDARGNCGAREGEEEEEREHDPHEAWCLRM